MSVVTQEFVGSMGDHWKTNLPLAPWQGGFFEQFVRSTKGLLRKQSKNFRVKNYKPYYVK